MSILFLPTKKKQRPLPAKNRRKLWGYCQEMQYCYCKSRGQRVLISAKGTEEIKVSAISVQKVVDTTGAGDYFASGFLYGLTCGYSLDKCAKIGSIPLGKCYSGN